MRTLLPRSARHAPLAPALGAALALGACGDGEFDDPVPVGGGAGDAEENAAVLGAYAGTWDLTDPQAPGAQERYLVIDAPGAEGESAARVFEFDDFDNCYAAPPGDGAGTVSVDPNGFGVFMNDILSFEQALLTLPNDATLEIEHGPTGARVTESATRNDGLVDFQPRC